MAYPLTVRKKVRELLAAGLSGKEIARKLNIARGTVSNIRNGRHEPQKKSVSTDYVDQNGREGHCEQCGALVMLPCRACAVRAMPDHRFARRTGERLDNSELARHGPSGRPILGSINGQQIFNATDRW